MLNLLKWELKVAMIMILLNLDKEKVIKKDLLIFWKKVNLKRMRQI